MSRGSEVQRGIEKSKTRVMATSVALLWLALVTAGCGTVVGTTVGARSGTAVGAGSGEVVTGTLIGGGIGTVVEAIYGVTRQSAVSGTRERSALQPVYFAPNGAHLSEEARAILRHHARWLRANPQARFRVEGHTDEQGTEQYNLALGADRAEAVKSYLASLGIEKGRLTTISYGAERPADEGHHEAAWGKNRRVEFNPM
jgi:peptidoglycan-associated lipoprotein